MTRERFTTLVSGEQKKLRQFLLALCCGHADEADDIAQDALVKAYLASPGLDEEARFAAWLYKIAYNTFLDHKRSRAPLVPIDPHCQLADTRRADDAFRYQALYAALAALPPKERTAILLYYLKGYSIHEISRIEDCSEEAVRKQMSRGREELKKICKRNDTGLF